MFLARRGMQLLELVISLTTASILMAGITGSILIANKSMEVAAARQISSARTQAGLDRLRADLAEGFPATTRAATGVTVSVSDRNGDGARERVQYQWSGLANSPLQMSINEGSWADVTDDLDEFELLWSSAVVPLNTQRETLDVPGSLVFQSFTNAFTLSSNNLSLVVPETFRAGDLLVAVVAVQGDASGATASGDWQLGPRQANGSDATVLTFFNLSPVNNSLQVTWNSTRAAQGAVAHFTTPLGTANLANSSTLIGQSKNPIAPLANASAASSLVIRVLAAQGSLQLQDACNMPDHASIVIRRDLSTNPIMGMAYRYYPAGTVQEAMFEVTNNAKFATATLVFQP
jgi:hypothetical protein